MKKLFAPKQDHKSIRIHATVWRRA